MHTNFISRVVLITALSLSPACGWPYDERCTSGAYSMTAFGGDFNVPADMHLVVNVLDDNSIEIRMVWDPEMGGHIKIIRIIRNGRVIQTVDSRLEVIEEYQVNGFKVEILGKNGVEVVSGQRTAVVSRSGDSAQVVFDSRDALDELLRNAESLD